MSAEAEGRGPIKDEEQRSVPAQWRPTLKKIVDCFVRGDYALAGIEGVKPLAKADAERIQRYVLGYGETLVELSDETWKSSVVQWTGGEDWDVLVDLWTAESGRSDLGLFVLVRQQRNKPVRMQVRSVHVP